MGKLHKVPIKIEVIGTCSKSILSSKGAMAF